MLIRDYYGLAKPFVHVAGSQGIASTAMTPLQLTVGNVEKALERQRERRGVYVGRQGGKKSAWMERSVVVMPGHHSAREQRHKVRTYRYPKWMQAMPERGCILAQRWSRSSTGSRSGFSAARAQRVCFGQRRFRKCQKR